MGYRGFQQGAFQRGAFQMGDDITRIARKRRRDKPLNVQVRGLERNDDDEVMMIVERFLGEIDR